MPSEQPSPDWAVENAGGARSLAASAGLRLPADEAELEELLARPVPLAVEALRRLAGQSLLILGAGGKMGPSLVRLARRAALAAGVEVEIIAVSRFSQPQARADLEALGISVLAGDLLDPDFRRTLPAADNVLLMTGHKFSRHDPPGAYFAMNTYLPGVLAEQYRQSRIVAFSSGNVYPFVPDDQPAPDETTPLAPIGEYAQSVLGRERLLEYVSSRYGTPVCLLRLNYAVEGRYGVLVDIGQKLLAGEPIDLAVPQMNFVWQGYANAVALRAFELAASPAVPLNLTGLRRHEVADVATRLAERLGVEVGWGSPRGPSSLVSDARRCHELFGSPELDDEALIELTAAWLKGGRRTLGKPTGFQVRTGKF